MLESSAMGKSRATSPVMPVGSVSVEKMPSHHLPATRTAVTGSRHNPSPLYLFSHWARTATRLRRAKAIALFMDFDGTLAPLKSRPQRVRLPADVRLALTRLSLDPKVRMWVVSGRLRADVQKRVNVAGIEHLGLHGWDRRNGPSLSLKAFQSLRTARQQIRERLRGLAGVWIEDKAPIFAIHYREASESAARQAAAAVREVVGQPLLASELRLIEGLKVWEILPTGFKGKGAAITAVMATLPSDTLAVYLGDETTDESGFAALPKGVTIRVGGSTRRTTAARFYVHDPAEVARFLDKIEETIR